MRNMQKELMKAMLQPNGALKAMQDAGEFTSQLVWQEEIKNYPFSDVWEEFCRRMKVPAGEAWLSEVEKYEKEVLLAR
jgi:L-rhamnose isomerase